MIQKDGESEVKHGIPCNIKGEYERVTINGKKVDLICKKSKQIFGKKVKSSLKKKNGTSSLGKYGKTLNSEDCMKGPCWHKLSGLNKRRRAYKSWKELKKIHDTDNEKKIWNTNTSDVFSLTKPQSDSTSTGLANKAQALNLSNQVTTDTRATVKQNAKAAAEAKLNILINRVKKSIQKIQENKASHKKRLHKRKEKEGEAKIKSKKQNKASSRLKKGRKQLSTNKRRPNLTYNIKPVVLLKKQGVNNGGLQTQMNSQAEMIRQRDEQMERLLQELTSLRGENEEEIRNSLPKMEKKLENLQNKANNLEKRSV